MMTGSRSLAGRAAKDSSSSLRIHLHLPAPIKTVSGAIFISRQPQREELESDKEH
jgi:hypothetical protein